MQPIAKDNPIRILLGPTPWPLTDIGAAHSGIEISLLKKVRPSTAGSNERHVYYDADSIAAVSDFCPDERFNRLLNACVSDPMCYYLAERERTNVFDGSLSASAKIAEFASYALRICENNRPDIIIFHNYPHELFTYILLTAAVHAGVRVFIIHFSVLPWRMRISRVTSDLRLRSIENPKGIAESETPAVLEYYERLRGTHGKAMPPVDRELRNRAGDKFLSVRGELRGMLRANPVKHLVRMYIKRRSFNALRSAEVARPAGPYVVFFLHYQPEESTLPRGGIFAQQVIAISKLRSLVPQSVNVVVKEHPSMFRYDHTLSISVRGGQFYTLMRRLRGVYLVPQETETFDLIDNSIAVATITGTVAIEALARGKPVLCFGEAYYAHFSGVTCYRDLNDSAATFEKVHNPLKTRDDLLREVGYSFGANGAVNSSDVDTQHEAALAAYEFLFANVQGMAPVTSGLSAIDV